MRTLAAPLALVVLASLSLAQERLLDPVHELLPHDEHETRDVAAADFDGDGALDLFLARLGPNTVLGGDGSGSFQDAGLVPGFSESSYGVALGDLDGDEDVDAMLANWADTNRLYLWGPAGFGDGTTQLPTPTIHKLSNDVALGDVDNDGDLDAYFANSVFPLPGVGDLPDQLLINDGFGNFSDGSGLLPPDLNDTQGVAFGDVDEDGNLDLFLANGPTSVSQDPRNELLLGDGTGGFTQGVLPVDSAGSSDVVLVDVDADGHLDALVANLQALVPTNQLLLGDGAGGFADVPGLLPADTDGTWAISVADLEGDGDVDFVAGNSGPDRLYVNDGSGAFTETLEIPEGASFTRSVLLADLDANGAPDLVVGKTGLDLLLLGDGQGDLVDVGDELFAGGIAALGDVDGDGDPDIVQSTVVSSVPGPTLVYANEGFGVYSIAGPPIPAGADDVWCSLLHDLDGDGDRDLFLGTAGLAHVYRNDGSGVFAEITSALPSAVDRIAAVGHGDFDGDQDIDLFVGQNGGLGLDVRDMLLLNDGNAVFSDGGALLPSVPFGTTLTVAIGDIEPDGDLDVITGGIHELRLLVNQDGAGFTDGSSMLPASGSIFHNTIAFGDLDGDVDLDLYVTLPGPDLYLRNDGALFTDHSDTLPASSSTSHTTGLADLDGDGDLDVVGGNVFYANDGFGLLTDETDKLPTGGPAAISILGDLDDDGDLDAWFCSPEGNSAWMNRLRHLSWRTPARVGRDLVLDVRGPPNEAWALAFSLSATRISLPPHGVLFLDPAAVFLGGTGSTGATGLATLAFPVPDDPVLVGIDIFWQAGVGFSPTRYTNGERTRVLGF